MIRKCDGTDPNLVMNIATPELAKSARGKLEGLIAGSPIRHGGTKGMTPLMDYVSKPCDCGTQFDDVNHFVFWPHTEF